MEKKTNVKSPLAAIRGAALLEPPSRCAACHCLLHRHGGLIRERDDTVRVRKGRYRCPHCSLPMSTCSPAAKPTLPLWHRSVEQYLRLVGTHGLPEEDRPKRCPKGCPCQRIPHRHSHYWRWVFILSQCERICIFRFRCPGCGYVHSVIPTFLEPYQRIALDLQEDLVNAVHQGATLETVAEITDTLPGGSLHEKTIGRLVRGWNERLAQLESGLGAWLLERVPHLTLPRCSSLWQMFRNGWQMLREQVGAFRDIRFLHGLNRLCFSVAVTVHG